MGKRPYRHPFYRIVHHCMSSVQHQYCLYHCNHETDFSDEQNQHGTDKLLLQFTVALPAGTPFWMEKHREPRDTLSKTDKVRKVKGFCGHHHHAKGTMQKPPRWCPWISTAKSDLDSFLSARNRFCNHFPS